MTKQQKLQQDIEMAQRRVNLKEQYIPQLLANCKDADMIIKYRDGIQQEKSLIARWTAQLAK